MFQLDSVGKCQSRNLSTSSFLLNSSAWIDDVNRDIIARNDVVHVPLHFGDSVTLKCKAPSRLALCAVIDPVYNFTLL